MNVLILEFWGLGDAIIMTPLLQALRAQNVSVTVACKPGSAKLLSPSYPEVEYVTADMPWTAFRGKYHLWKWDWKSLAAYFHGLRRRNFDVVLSVRPDPRDQMLMWLMGIRRRIGFKTHFSNVFLTDVLSPPVEPRPVAENWMALQKYLFPGTITYPPALRSGSYPNLDILSKLSANQPVIGLHTGARIPVRRWATDKFRELIIRLRKEYQFSLLLFPDLDGYGGDLEDLADVTLYNTDLEHLVGAISHCDLLICNDSAPAHIADALGVNVISVFGPTDPIRFRPYSPRNLVVIRDICPHRPCFDYCRFAEPYCLSKLEVSEIWPEVAHHLNELISSGGLLAHLRKKTH